MNRYKAVYTRYFIFNEDEALSEEEIVGIIEDALWEDRPTPDEFEILKDE